jgi:hypothetical protein
MFPFGVGFFDEPCCFRLQEQLERQRHPDRNRPGATDIVQDESRGGPGAPAARFELLGHLPRDTFNTIKATVLAPAAGLRSEAWLERVTMEETDENAAPQAQVCLGLGVAIAAVLDIAEDGSIVSAEEIKKFCPPRGYGGKKGSLRAAPSARRIRFPVTVKKTILTCFVKNTRPTVIAGILQQVLVMHSRSCSMGTSFKQQKNGRLRQCSHREPFLRRR